MPPSLFYSQGMDFKSHCEYVLFRGVLSCLKPLSYQRSTDLLRRTARVVGPLLGVRRKVVKTQLHRVFPDLSAGDLASLAGKVYDHLGLTMAEVLCAAPDTLFQSVDIAPGWGMLDRALAQGHGAIAATGHIGNFELGGRVLAQRFPLLDVVKTQRNAPFDRFLQEQRLRFGIRTVPVERSGRAVLAHLKGGGLVTLLVDQDAGKTGFVTDFLGLPASTWPGAAKISIRTGCPVIPMAILRNDDRTHTLHIGEALLPQGLKDREVDIREFSGRISVAVEQYIWDRPEQWFWVHRRWKGAAEARGVDESNAEI
jgi:KDO2-lipid IV(A) lauroyltransferase